ncbi:MAG: aminopeptidase P family protein [Erysipelotrichaceae bacterium]|nr:aminopeptidase P family protein [Erysipelotrichaceae bacterium]
MENNRKAQRIASETLDELVKIVKPGMSEAEIEKIVCELMIEKGSGPFWYHGVGALVLLGDRSIESLSARNYTAVRDNCLKDTDILTVDCSPTFNGEWGDYARTIFLENGKAVSEDEVSLPEFRKGLDAELELHRSLKEEMNPDMTYEEVYLRLSERIKELGFINLDFHGNLGHSIETDEKKRICLEMGNKKTFREYGKPFTLEPHICIDGTKYGYKRENIYYIENNRFELL